MKVGQKGKVTKKCFIYSVDQEDLPTRDEHWVDEGIFTIVEIGSDCIVINLDYGHRDAETFEGDPINWIVDEDEYDNIKVK